MMTEHQFSARFKKDTPEAFTNEEFQKRLGEFFAGFIDCYPHLIEKQEFDKDNETWIFKFAIEVPKEDIAKVNTCCNILFSGDDFKDKSGCLKPSGHSDHHICRTDEGILMAYDYDWDCGCADCRTDSFSDMCMIYWEVPSIES